jgi:hypothetical protein
LKVAECLWPDENLRRSILDRWVTSSQSVYFCKTGSFFESVIPRLLDHGVMTGSGVQAAWDQMKAREAESNRKWLRSKSRPDRVEHPESLGENFLSRRWYWV